MAAVAFLLAVAVALLLVVDALRQDAGSAGGSETGDTASETTIVDGTEGSSGAGEEEPPSETVPPSSTTTVFSGAVTKIEAASISASSALEPTDENDYAPENMLDGDLTTAWNEAAEGVGEGEWFRIELTEPAHVRLLKIANGYQKDTERFLGNARIREMTITFSDGSSQSAVLEDEEGYQDVPLNGALTEWVKVTVTDAYGGDVWEDLAVSEVEVYAEEE